MVYVLCFLSKRSKKNQQQLIATFNYLPNHNALYKYLKSSLYKKSCLKCVPPPPCALLCEEGTTISDVNGWFFRCCCVWTWDKLMLFVVFLSYRTLHHICCLIYWSIRLLHLVFCLFFVVKWWHSCCIPFKRKTTSAVCYGGIHSELQWLPNALRLHSHTQKACWCTTIKTSLTNGVNNTLRLHIFTCTHPNNQLGQGLMFYYNSSSHCVC